MPELPLKSLAGYSRFVVIFPLLGEREENHGFRVTRWVRGFRDA